MPVRDEDKKVKVASKEAAPTQVVKDPLLEKCKAHYTKVLGEKKFAEDLQEIRARVMEMVTPEGDTVKTHVVFTIFKQNEVENIKEILFDYHCMKDEAAARKLPVMEVVTPEVEGDNYILCFYEAKNAQQNAEKALKLGVQKG